jgi:pyruvate/2-oxoglutarate dehydrogenase complex dihydrolipoamide acyltransferase (E2) component
LKPAYNTFDWPEIRNLVADNMAIAAGRPTIYSLFELDYTKVKKEMREREKSLFKGLSLNAYIVFLFAHLLQQNKGFLYFRHGKKKIVVFDEIDVLTIVEKRAKGQQSVPVAAIIRNAGSRTFYEINEILRGYQKMDALDIPGVKARRQLLKYPSFLRKFLMKRIVKNPFLNKKYYGDVSVSSLSLNSGNRAWWGIPIATSPLALMPSGIYKKVIFENGIPVEKDFLSITVAMNHEVIDGGPAQRFFHEFALKFEQAYGI